MGRAPCCDKANVKKGPWAPEEDAKLKEFIEKYGTGGNWIALPQKAGLKRCGKSCRLRWLNYLRPNIKHGEFSDDEDRIICTLYASIGSRWSIIAAQLPGRTDNDIKNYWNTKLKKKLLSLAVPSPLNKRFYSQFYPSSSLQLPQQHPSQDLSSYFAQLNNNNNNNTSLITSLLNHHEQQLQSPNIPLSFSSSNPLNMTNSYSSLFQGQESLYSTSPMQYYPGVGMREGLLMFGNEASTNTCSSSDNGSCMSSQISYGKEIKQEDQITLQGTTYNISTTSTGFDNQHHQNQSFVIDYGNNGGGLGYHEHDHQSTKGYFGNNNQLTPLQFDLEEVKQLMTSSSNNNNSNNNGYSCMLNDENKTNERGSLYYY